MDRFGPIRVLPLSDAGITDLFVPVLLVLVGVAVLIGVIAAVRKWLSAPEEAEAAGGFSLGSLRELVRQGKMTPAEFEQAKAQIVAATHRAAAREAAAAKPDVLKKP